MSSARGCKESAHFPTMSFIFNVCGSQTQTYFETVVIVHKYSASSCYCPFTFVSVYFSGRHTLTHTHTHTWTTTTLTPPTHTGLLLNL